MEVRLIGLTRYLEGEGEPENLLEHAGRVCYRSQSKGEPGKFLQARIREGHESIIEHCSLTFEVSGISRACSHQLVRHRIASYSQESQRWVDMSSPQFVIPPSISSSEEARQVWDEFMAKVQETYRAFRALGIPKEDARFILPNATTTHIVVTMNFRELRHFFTVRCDKAAQWEIRALAKEILKISYDVAPAIFEDLYYRFILENGE